jgi:prepilin-type N-terminal cleavage/methylation domain-containing protein
MHVCAANGAGTILSVKTFNTMCTLRHNSTGRYSNTSGMTMVELMVTVVLFALFASGLLAGFIQTRKISESNLYEVSAQTIAQSIMEQIVRIPPSMLADSTLTSVTIKLPSLTSDNRTSLADFSLPWAGDSTTYTAIGNTAQGVLIDAEYKSSTATIRPSRYMLMRINMQRTIENTENRIRVVVRYQWETPERKNSDGSVIYRSGEMRTVRSNALRF